MRFYIKGNGVIDLIEVFGHLARIGPALFFLKNIERPLSIINWAVVLVGVLNEFLKYRGNGLVIARIDAIRQRP